MFNIGPLELLLILALALVVVGPQKLPELSRQIGRGLREFRKVQDEVKDMVTFDLNDEPTPRRSEPAKPRPHRSVRPAAAGPNGSTPSGEAGSTDEPPVSPTATADDVPPTSPTPTTVEPPRVSPMPGADQPPASPTPTDVPPTSPTPPSD
jgi:sec-independent protein translocase protein TatA